jgi:ribonuclease R
VKSDDILRAFETRVTHPSSARELIQLLKVPREARVSFRRQLRVLAADGSLVQIRGQRFALPGRMDVLVGELRMHPDGYGFVIPDEARDRDGGDLYISPANLKDAMHGDRVAARVERRSAPQRREGKVVRIIERGPSRVVGSVVVDRGGRCFVEPHEKRLVQRIAIPPADIREAKPGDFAEVEIAQWPTATRGPIGRIVEVFGSLDEPGVDTRVVIRKHGLPDVHSDEAVTEAARLGTEVRPRDLEGRTDFRAWQTVTIDGEDARDFDDAISLDRLPNGHFWLAVHIADVAHYVAEGSALDREAYERGTSVYFPERAIHMFPAELATGLCSLRPEVDRLVQSCLMEINSQGDVVRSELHDGVIRSDARMTYTAVNAVLTDGDSEARAAYAPLVPLFERMRELFEVLNARRRRRGSIDFDLPESEIILDEAGRVAAITAAERNVAHRLIEEFMLLANETVASHLESAQVPSLYRIHEAPDPARVAEFEEFVASVGYSLAAAPTGVRPGDFQRLVGRIAGTPVEKPIAFLMLRTMQQARYEAVNVGHFGLASPCYTHFTSPIRRYPDLVVHRILREARHGAIDAARAEALAANLPEIGRHASVRERRAMDAERELVHWKKVRFMADKVGEAFDGYVTGVSAFGLFVELIDPFVEGLVHVSTMADDYYRYLDTAHVLRGERTNRVFRLGDRVRVQVARVDIDRRLIDLGLVDVLESMRVGRREASARRTKARPKSDRRGRTPRQPRRGKQGRRSSRR